MDLKDFELYHYPNNQPAVFKDILFEWPAWTNWKKHDFIKRYLVDYLVAYSGCRYSEYRGNNFHICTIGMVILL